MNLIYDFLSMKYLGISTFQNWPEKMMISLFFFWVDSSYRMFKWRLKWYEEEKRHFCWKEIFSNLPSSLDFHGPLDRHKNLISFQIDLIDLFDINRTKKEEFFCTNQFCILFETSVSP